MSAERIKELEELVQYHSELYYNQSNPEISDAEFDALFDELKVLSPDSPVLLQVGFVPSYGRKLTHSQLMGSLEKVNTIDELMAWMETGKKINASNVTLTPKIDGLAIRLNYKDGILVEAATRGNGEVGMDVMDNVKEIKEIPKKLYYPLTGEVRGEVYMKKSVWKNSGGGFANPRNAASGSLCTKDPKVTGERNLSFFAYDVICDDDMIKNGLDETSRESMDCMTDYYKDLFFKQSLKEFDAVDFKVFHFIDDFTAIVYDWEHSLRHKIDYEIDGLVFSFNSSEIQDELGWNGRRPRFRTAFKFKPEQKESEILAIDWQVGRTGKLTPVARIEPTQISGSVVSNITLHNHANVMALGVNVGDKVLFEKAGEIIPQVVRVTEKINTQPYDMIGECPSCGSVPELDERGVSYWCNNVYCGARLEERVHYYLKTLDVLGVGSGLIKAFCEAGMIKELPDIYSMSFNEVKYITGGERSALKVNEAILSKNEIPLWQFLCSLGIHHLGNTTSKQIASEFKTLGEVRKLTPADLLPIEGIGDLMADSIVNGLSELSDMIDKLVDYVDILDVQEATGALAGKTFCITGSLSRGKKEVGKDIEDAGGTMKSSVGKGLDYLIMADPNSTSSKAEKARKLGTKCISEDELLGLINA
jgi:DNA ligase (NAD+)